MMKLVDIADLLNIDMQKVEQWVKRDLLPARVQRNGRGSPGLVHFDDARPLGVWLSLADQFGPIRADVVLAAYRPQQNIEFPVGYLRMSVDVRAVEEIIGEAIFMHTAECAA